MPLLCDLGGTHIRFALNGGAAGELQAPVKLPAAHFTGLADAVSHYAKSQGVSAQDGILLAATGPLSQPWPAESTVAEDTRILGRVSDFEASAWGAPLLSGDQLLTLRPGIGNPAEPRAILGPGTGLGLAYMLPEADGRWRIQKTHGGHMQAALLSEEHMLLAALISRLKGNAHTIIYENFCSGRSLPVLYKAVCQMQGEKAQEIACAEDLLKLDMHPALQTCLRVFHEMLGLFAHSCAVTLNAYGGLYFDGGMVQRLRERNLFDVDTVLRFMTLDPVATVRDDLDKMPVWLVNDPFIALRGLAAMDRAGKFEGAHG